MLRPFRKWRALPASERRDALALLLLHPMVSLALRGLGYRRTLALLTKTGKGHTLRASAPENMRHANRLAELAKAVGQNGAIEASCLRQSLAVFWLLRRRGLLPEVKLGVGRLGDGAPDMHAWVELDGEALAQPGLRHAAFEVAVTKLSETTAITSGKRA